MEGKKLKMVKSFIRYKLSILSGIVIIVGLVVSICYFGELKPVIAAVGGLLFSIPIRFFWQSYMGPVLIIKGVEHREFNPGDIRWKYIANRIIVENGGRSAAKNCKGYIVVRGGKERVCWTVSTERPNATINASDDERLDFCAFYESAPSMETITYKNRECHEEKQITIPKLIAPTEEKWGDPWECRDLDKINECKVLITADNNEPVEATIKFNIEKKEIEIVTT